MYIREAHLALSNAQHIGQVAPEAQHLVVRHLMRDCHAVMNH
jgi:hypothetical protein